MKRKARQYRPRKLPVQKDARRAQALALKLDGYTDKEIAEALSVSQETAKRMYRSLLEENKSSLANEYRQIINQRLEAAVKAIMPSVKAGKPSSIDRLVQISREQARLHGAYSDKAEGFSGNIVVIYKDERGEEHKIETREQKLDDGQTVEGEFSDIEIEDEEETEDE